MQEITTLFPSYHFLHDLFSGQAEIDLEKSKQGIESDTNSDESESEAE